MRDERKTKKQLIAELTAAHEQIDRLEAAGHAGPDALSWQFVRASPMGIHRYRLEPSGRLIFIGANPAADRLLGIDNTRFVGKSIEEAFPPLVETELPDRYRAAARDGVSWTTEQLSYEDDQIKGAYEVHVFQTAPNEMAALFLEITERKRTEESLRASEARLQSLFSAAPVGIGLVRGRVITHVNKKFGDLLGYSAEEMLDRSARFLYPTQAEFDLVGQEKYQQILEHGTGTVETRMQRKDGEIIEVLLSSTPLDRGDLTAGVTFTVLDITDRKRSARRLSRLTERLAALGTDYQENLDLLTQLVGELLNGRAAAFCRFENERVIFAASWKPPKDLGRDYPASGLLCSDVLASETEDVLVVSDLQRSSYAKSDPFVSALGIESCVCRLVSCHGKPIGALSVAYEHDFSPTADDGRLLGTVARAIGAEEDRRYAEEERRNLEAQIQHAQKLESLGVLAGGIAHDFNNLLAGILGNTSVALLDLPFESPVRDCIQDVERSARRAADLVRQMLAYAGKGRFVVDVLSLESVVTEMAHLLEVSISKKAVLRYNFAADVPPVRADATQLRQVVMNLITNASDAIGDESGVIAISTGVVACDHAYLAETFLDDDLAPGVFSWVEVSDTGCGMDEDTVQRIFDPFFSTKFTGRGLGLAAVLGIVRGHHGAIKVYSEVGRGTTVKVLFPSDEGATARGEEPMTKPESWSPSGTVLLVDDEEIVRTTATRMLERLGFDVVMAVDGREAIEVFREHEEQIVCVLLDLTMPNVDGEQCFEELRRIKREVCVVLSSGYNEQDLIDRFAGKGLAGFIQKPYSTQSLSAKLRDVLGG